MSTIQTMLAASFVLMIITAGCSVDRATAPRADDLAWLLYDEDLFQGDDAHFFGRLLEASSQQRADLHYAYEYAYQSNVHHLNPRQRLKVALAYWRLNEDQDAWARHDQAVQTLTAEIEDTAKRQQRGDLVPLDSPDADMFHFNFRGAPVGSFLIFIYWNGITHTALCSSEPFTPWLWRPVDITLLQRKEIS